VVVPLLPEVPLFPEVPEVPFPFPFPPEVKMDEVPFPPFPFPFPPEVPPDVKMDEVPFPFPLPFPPDVKMEEVPFPFPLPFPPDVKMEEDPFPFPDFDPVIPVRMMRDWLGKGVELGKLDVAGELEIRMLLSRTPSPAMILAWITVGSLAKLVMSIK